MCSAVIISILFEGRLESVSNCIFLSVNSFEGEVLLDRLVRQKSFLDVDVALENSGLLIWVLVLLFNNCSVEVVK